MKLTKRIIIGVCLLFIHLTQSGCKKGWLDVNYNPQQLTENNAEPYLMLPTVLIKGPTNINGESLRLLYWMGYWCLPSNFPPGTTESTYLLDFSSLLPGGSVNRVAFIYDLERKSKEMGQHFYWGIGKVIKALHWTREVDFKNNLPYTEAFKFDIHAPRYDKGEFIYEQEMKQLDSAILLIKNADVGKNIKIGIADIMFKGDKTKWIKFINTVKLRMLIHQANRPERAGYIMSELQKIREEGTGFLSSGENASLNPGFTEVNSNPTVYNNYAKYARERNAEILPDNSLAYKFERASANLFSLELLKSLKDPRLSFIYQPAELLPPPGANEPFSESEPRNFRGNQLGFRINTSDYKYQTASYLSLIKQPTQHGPVTPASAGIIKGYNMDMYILTSIESMFLQAEAILRGWLDGDAEQAYLNAVKESYRWLNVGLNSMNPAASDAVFTAYYNQQVTEGNELVSWHHAPDKYKLLMFQKYIAFNSIEPVEAYNDYRRNNFYPEIPLSVDPGRVGDRIPLRSPYPESEYRLNRENVLAQGEIDVFANKIWWMP